MNLIRALLMLKLIQSQFFHVFFLNLVTQELNFILCKYNESIRTTDRVTVPNYHIGSLQ